EAEAACVGAVPVRLDESGRGRQPRRRHRRRAADGCRGRHRREAAQRLLLQPDDRHVFRAGRRFCGCGASRGDRRPGGQPRRAGDGSAAGMSALLRFWQPLCALVLVAASLAYAPIVSGAEDAGTTGIIALLAFGGSAAIYLKNNTASAAVLFVTAHAAVWLLLDALEGRTGAATASYYLLLAAAWLLAWRLVTVLSALKPRQRAIDIALKLFIPLLFGAWI